MKEETRDRAAGAQNRPRGKRVQQRLARIKRLLAELARKQGTPASFDRWGLETEDMRGAMLAVRVNGQREVLSCPAELLRCRWADAEAHVRTWYRMAFTQMPLVGSDDC